MTILESAEIRTISRRSGRSGALVAAVVVIAVGAFAAVWMMSDGNGPVPAEDARVEITFTDDGTSFVGDREIVEGTVTVTFDNETDGRAVLVVLGYETGSAALAEELAFVEEGSSFVTSAAPTAGYFEIEFEGQGELVPGTHSWTMDLDAGYTYLIDLGAEDYKISGIWRAVVIDVVDG